jgi:hypothetical protein
MLTRVEMLDAAIEHYSKPDAVYGFDPEAKGDHGTGMCRYRGGGDPSSQVRCFVGVQIPDELYNPVWDKGPGVAYMGVLAQLDKLVDLFNPMDRSWIGFMQNEHDDRSGTLIPVSDYVKWMKVVRLNMPPRS